MHGPKGWLDHATGQRIGRGRRPAIAGLPSLPIPSEVVPLTFCGAIQMDREMSADGCSSRGMLFRSSGVSSRCIA